MDKEQFTQEAKRLNAAFQGGYANWRSLEQYQRMGYEALSKAANFYAALRANQERQEDNPV